MTQQEAIRLIASGVNSRSKTARTWVDMGCGTGTFTKALASLLPSGSVIHAIDSDPEALRKVPDHQGEIRIVRVTSDYLTAKLPDLPDGVLMGNFLHFVREKEPFLKHLLAQLKPDGVIILIEYDTDLPNPWVPYPVSLHTLRSLALSSGASSVKKLAEKPSLYQRANLYAALLQK